MITQQSLEFDTKVKFNDNPEIQAMVEREQELLDLSNNLTKEIKSVNKELKELRKKLRPLQKKAGLYKGPTKLIYEFIKNNPGCTFSEVAQFYSDNISYTNNYGVTSSVVDSLLGNGRIKNEDKLYYIVVNVKKRPYGILPILVDEYTNSVEWFKVSNVIDHLAIKGYSSSSTNVSMYIRRNKDKFETNSITRRKFYRLKDEYRTTPEYTFVKTGGDNAS